MFLQKALSELESMENPQEIVSKVKQVNERATLFRITSTAMINVNKSKDRLGYLSNKQ